MNLRDIDLELLHGRRNEMMPIPEGKIHPSAAEGIMANNVQIAQRILNLCSSVAIASMHKGLKEVHMALLNRAYKVDLTLLEVDDSF